jgi:xylono-1,5-lactonase
MQIECVAAAGARLGEGALWDAARGVVWWLDIRAAVLHCHEVQSGRNHAQDLDCRLTALGLADQGDLVACGDRGFVRLGIAQGFRARIKQVLQAPRERPGNRFNDGKVDDRGRFWAGTMDDAEGGAHGSLYRLEGNGNLSTVRTGMFVPNGPCFLADGTVLVTDSPRRHITALLLDERGEPIAEREFAQFGVEHGFPDGMTVDADNHVWVAFWDGWCVRRISPHGKIVAEIELPVQRPTCPTFGGEHLEDLYLTTASTGIAAERLSTQPLAGSLLRISTGVRGRTAGRFCG